MKKTMGNTPISQRVNKWVVLELSKLRPLARSPEHIRAYFRNKMSHIKPKKHIKEHHVKTVEKPNKLEQNKQRIKTMQQTIRQIPTTTIPKTPTKSPLPQPQNTLEQFNQKIKTMQQTIRQIPTTTLPPEPPIPTQNPIQPPQSEEPKPNSDSVEKKIAALKKRLEDGEKE